MFDEASAKLQLLKFSNSFWRYGYPPEWHKFKPWFTSSALAPIKIWLGIAPVVVALVSVLPIEVLVGTLEVKLGGEFVPPFSFLLSLIAAIVYLFSYAVFALRCPQFIRQHPPQFDRLPENTTNTDLARQYRTLALNGLPRQHTTQSGRTFVRREAGNFADNQLDDSVSNCPEISDVKEMEELWNAKASYSSKALTSTGYFPLTANPISDANKRYYQPDGAGGFKFKMSDYEVRKDVANLIFVPDLQISKRTDDPNFISTKTYTNVYYTLSESRAVGRAIVWATLCLSSALGLIVVVQIIGRGLKVFLAL